MKTERERSLLRRPIPNNRPELTPSADSRQEAVPSPWQVLNQQRVQTSSIKNRFKEWFQRELVQVSKVCISWGLVILHKQSQAVPTGSVEKWVMPMLAVPECLLTWIEGGQQVSAKLFSMNGQGHRFCLVNFSQLNGSLENTHTF